MARIPEQYIKRLQSAGLFVSNPWPSAHVFPDHILVGKPVGVPGNSIPEYTTSFGLTNRIEFDAPPIRLFSDGEAWFVLAEEYCPGPGPGDFSDEWKTAEEAVDDILDFYFGNSERMEAKAEARKRVIRESDNTDSAKRASA